MFFRTVAQWTPIKKSVSRVFLLCSKFVFRPEELNIFKVLSYYHHEGGYAIAGIICVYLLAEKSGF